jgi:hypothetical protein
MIKNSLKNGNVLLQDKFLLWLNNHKFEAFSISIWITYVLFRFIPSSFSLALQQLGAKNDGLLFGSPRPIKSDEWTTLTPSIISRIVHPNLNSFYNHSAYILNDPLPRDGIRKMFQPFSWGFFFEPALGYSIYLTASFVIGVIFWPAALRLLGLKRTTSIIGGLSIMFSPFVIGWYTHRPGIYGLLPLLIYIFIKEFKSPLPKFLISFWMGVVYLEFTFYPPETILSLHFAILIILYRGNLKENFKDYWPPLLGYLSAGMFYVLVNWSVWEPYGSTLYPGQRKVESGLLPMESFFTQFFPIGFGQSYVTQFAPSNELESATFSSIFVMVIIFLTRKQSDKRFNYRLSIFYAALLIVSLFEIVPSMGFLGKFTLLDRVPPNRSLFLSGLLITFIALQHLDRRSPAITRLRIFLVTITLFAIYLTPPIIARFENNSNYSLEFNRSDIFLAASTLLIGGLALSFKSIGITRCIILLSLPLWVISAHWNPIASSKTFFQPIKSPVVSALENIENSTASGKVAVYGFPGLVLNAAGFVTITDRSDIPDLKTLRKMFPNLTKSDFELIFNRAAEIRIDPDQFTKTPLLLQANLVTIPIATAQEFAATVSQLKFAAIPRDGLKNLQEITTPNYIDKTTYAENVCSLVGWVKTKDVDEVLTIYYPKTWTPFSAIRTLRPDVLKAVSGAGLYNGIELKFIVLQVSKPAIVYISNNSGVIAKWSLDQCGGKL